jgi:hypothetical protein
VVVRIDEAGHQKVLRQIDLLQVRMPPRHVGERTDVFEAPGADDDAEVARRSVGLEGPFRSEQHRVGGEGALQVLRVFHRSGLHLVHR